MANLVSMMCEVAEAEKAKLVRSIHDHKKRAHKLHKLHQKKNGARSFLEQSGMKSDKGNGKVDPLVQEERLLKIRPILMKLAKLDTKKFGSLQKIATTAQNAADAQILKSN